MTYNCKKCGSENVVVVQYAYNMKERYDGWSEINCQDCKTRIGRWTGKELKEGEFEPRFGKQD